MQRLLSYVLIVAVALVASSANAVTDVGHADYVKKWAYHQQPDAAKDDLFEREAVYMNDRVWTVENGAARIELNDDTELRLGSAAEVTIDSFVYDPETNAGEAATQIVQGTMRYVSGQLNRDNVEVETPTVVIGIRGTRFDVTVAEDGATRVDVIEGAVVVTSKATGKSTSVSAGQGVSVSSEGAIGETTSARPSYDDVLDDDAGIAPEAPDGGEPQGEQGGHR